MSVVKESLCFQLMTYQHLDWVLGLEKASFRLPWTSKDWRDTLAHPTAKCLVMYRETCPSENVGYVVHSRKGNTLQVANLAIAPEWRRKGFGGAILTMLAHRLQPFVADGAKRLRLDVDEQNLGAQLWLRALRFRCVSIEPSRWDRRECEYRFQFRPSAPAPALDPC